MARKTQKTIRVGVIGVGRGQSFMHEAGIVGMKLVAICDLWKSRLKDVGKRYRIATYTDYDKFLEHDMDAVVLANYFHEHAPFAIQALRAGKHVLSETSACKTLAEGVALCRAVEQTRRIYMLAENYPFTKFNLEMQRLYRAGAIGDVRYAEGEYNHPMDDEGRIRLSPGLKHWRNWLPSTYYCTHALAPLVHITDTMPVAVNALAITCAENDRRTTRVGDAGSVILCRMNNGSVFRIFGLLMPGHSNWYRLHGTRGAMEITRGPGYFGPEAVRIWHDEWNRKPGELAEQTYCPDWPAHGEQARLAGHGGGDFFVNLHFANAIRTGRPPFLDVYRGVAMSVVGILAWKSALENGAPYSMPDFRKESERRAHENDHWSPFPSDAGPGQPPPSIRGFVKPSRQGVTHARRIWREMGYTGE